MYIEYESPPPTLLEQATNNVLNEAERGIESTLGYKFPFALSLEPNPMLEAFLREAVKLSQNPTDANSSPSNLGMLAVTDSLELRRFQQTYSPSEAQDEDLVRSTLVRALHYGELAKCVTPVLKSTRYPKFSYRANLSQDLYVSSESDTSRRSYNTNRDAYDMDGNKLTDIHGYCLTLPDRDDHQKSISLQFDLDGSLAAIRTQNRNGQTEVKFKKGKLSYFWQEYPNGTIFKNTGEDIVPRWVRKKGSMKDFYLRVQAGAKVHVPGFRRFAVISKDEADELINNSRQVIYNNARQVLYVRKFQGKTTATIGYLAINEIFKRHFILGGRHKKDIPLEVAYRYIRTCNMFQE